MNRKITVLRENEKQALIKIETLLELSPGKKYTTVRYEWWTDKEKMKKETYSEFNNGRQYIYCSGYAGANEQQLIRDFELGIN